MYIRTLRHVVRASNFTHLRTFSARFEGTSSQTKSRSPKESKPLRILFCGSDEFSSASLRALHAEHLENPQRILSIDVLCRPGKAVGRGLKTIRDPPIKTVAKELGLTVHETDTFTDWELPRPSNEPINLIIAVSFGLFIGRRILNGAEYGGLNVHPSLLPNFRGAAPLQHTILSGKHFCGVTLQTLDQKSFDHGIILAQTPQADTKMPKRNITYPELLDHVTPMAAELLVKGIRDKVFVPPLIPAGWYSTKQLIHAHKTSPVDRQINWRTQDALHIERIDRALGRTWNMISTDAFTTKRFIYEDIEIVPLPKVIEEWFTKQKETNTSIYELEIDLESPIRFMVFTTPENVKQAQLFVEDGDAIIISARNRKGIRIKEITVEGGARKSAAKVMRTINERDEWTLKRDKNRNLKPDKRGSATRNVKVKAIGPKIRMMRYSKAQIREITEVERVELRQR